MKRTRKSWRIVAMTLAVVLVLASTPAVAQTTVGTHVGSSNWFGWVVAQVGHFWQLVAGGDVGLDDGGGQLPDPKG